MKAAELVEEVILVAKIEVLEIVSDGADRAVLGEDEVREIGKRPEYRCSREGVSLIALFRDVSMLGLAPGMAPRNRNFLSVSKELQPSSPGGPGISACLRG
jgi:hypothetical protein